MIVTTVNDLLVQSYATNVYLTGRNTLAKIGDVHPDYVEPVKLKAAQAYPIEDIDHALTAGYITVGEHADTISLRGESELRRRSAMLETNQSE